MENSDNASIFHNKNDSPNNPSESTGWEGVAAMGEQKTIYDVSEFQDLSKEEKEHLREVHYRVREQEESEHNYAQNLKLMVKEVLSDIKDGWDDAKSLPEKIEFIGKAALLTVTSPVWLALTPLVVGADAIRFAVDKKRYPQDRAELDEFIYKNQPNEETQTQESIN